MDSTDNPYLKLHPKGNVFLPEYYEGFLGPRLGYSPFKIIDDPSIIAKKNQMRQALKDEHTRRIYNPYRWASNIGGYPVDPQVHRYNSMSRVGWEYFRPGPKFGFTGFFAFIAFPLLIYIIAEEIESRNELAKRTGQIAYKDRLNKWMT